MSCKVDLSRAATPHLAGIDSARPGRVPQPPGSSSLVYRFCAAPVSSRDPSGLTLSTGERLTLGSPRRCTSRVLRPSPAAPSARRTGCRPTRPVGRHGSPTTSPRSSFRRIVAGCGARWSPDGHRLVYTSTRGKGLFVVNIGGGAPRRLLTGRLPQAAAGWSRSGRVLFTRSHDHIGRIADVMVTNADGTGVRKLADGFAGSWSPRGTRILYTKTFFSALFVMNADGSHKHRVSRAIAAEPDWR
jgi:WD40-like Beta Propeller Repeat